jgi:hypothetical protein
MCDKGYRSQQYQCFPRACLQPYSPVVHKGSLRMDSGILSVLDGIIQLHVVCTARYSSSVGCLHSVSAMHLTSWCCGIIPASA